MKKLCTTLFLLLLVKTYALPIGNPQDPSLLCRGWFSGVCPEFIRFRAGFDGDYVYNRHLRGDSNHKNIETTDITTNSALVVANFWNRIDLFTTLGASQIGISTSDNSMSFFGPGVNNRLDLKTVTDFSWSLGLRGEIWSCRGTTLGIEGQYFQTDPSFRRVVEANFNTAFPSGITAHYKEWQVGLALSYAVGNWVPYVGAKWAGARLSFDNAIIVLGDGPLQLYSLRNRKDFGFAAGLTLTQCRMISFNIEGRFDDEKALHLNAQISF